MSARIHSTAIVDRTAEIEESVEIGPWAIVGPRCVVGPGSILQARSTLEENVRLGAHVTIGIGSVLGGKPQDLKFRGEVTYVEIGDHTTIREYVTINRGTSQSLKTTVGTHCFLMSYVHVAHDCHFGDHVIVSNGTQFAGHITVEDYAGISGLCAVHQFSRIGRHSFIGGCSRVPKDIPPFVRAAGNPIRLYGLNAVGLQRRGFSDDVIAEIKKAYRLLFRSELNVGQAVEQAARDLKPFPEVKELIAFVETSGRGVTV
ncbi:MAG TPA: acyl-ACP--UDP-N-acetylglucosamine O-acyltransferase [Gemmatimonadaceae bacterium]|nr:acyl-ACP--UDP-N-acetylglucosamine O-acyltransferase [Gemmatimonadaceae bacterium]